MISKLSQNYYIIIKKSKKISEYKNLKYYPAFGNIL